MADSMEEVILAAWKVMLGQTFPMAVGAPEFQKSLRGYVMLHQQAGGPEAFRQRMIAAMRDGSKLSS